MPERTARNRSVTYILLALMPLLFASNIIIGRAASADTPPIAMAFWRWLLAVIMLLPFAWGGLRRQWRQIANEGPFLFLLGALGMGICGAVVYIGLGLTSATNAALIYASSPVFIVVIEAILLKKPVSREQTLGIILAILGVVIILFKGEIRRIIQFHFNPGDLYIALASFSWAVYSVLLRNKRLASYGTLPLFTMIAMAGVIVLLPFFLWERGTAGDVPPQLGPWLSIAGVALMPSVLAFLIYKYGIRTVGPSHTALFLYFMPVYAALLAIVFLDEQLHIYHLVGLLLVMSGVIMATVNSETPHQSSD